MYDAAADLAEVTALIAEFGMDVTINGGPAVKSIVDERPERIAQAVPQDIFDSLDGRPGLFYFAPNNSPVANDKLGYDGQTWRVHPVRVIGAAGTELMSIVLATAGARA